MNQIQTLFFDLDGTLTNPFEGFANSILAALKELNIPGPSREELRRYIGPPVQETFSDLLKGHNGNVSEAINLYRKYYKAGGVYENYVYEKISETVEKLALRKTLYVVTS